jgi:small-conductance mechanosensitive channel
MKFFLLLLLLVSSVFAITVNKNWYDTNSSALTQRYDEQIKKSALLLNKSVLPAEEKERLEYQLLLLKKLKETLLSEQSPSYENIHEITSAKSYLQALNDYAKINQHLLQKSQESKNNQKSIKTLEDQLSQFKNSDDIVAVNTQLLYAYYVLQNRQNIKDTKKAQDYLDSQRVAYVNALKQITFIPSNVLKEKVQAAEALIMQHEKDKDKLSLALDKANISQNVQKTTEIQSAITSLHQKKSRMIENLLWLKVEALLPLLQNREADYFTEFKSLQLLMQQSERNYDALIELFKYISREYLGLTKTTFADTKESALDILSYGWKQLNEPFIPLGGGISVLAILQFVFIFVAGFLIASFYRRQITQSVKYLQNSSPSTRTMLSNLGYYFLVIITFVTALNSVGIDLSSLTMLVGALSVGIGFGLQNIVSNFIAGIILIFEKSIRIGDIIEVNAEFRGRVTQINMRSSVISTADNIDVIIPNSTFIQNDVINLTLNDDIRRLHIPFGVAYGSNIAHVQEIVLNALEQSDLVYIRNNPEKNPRVWMTGMGASSVDLKLLVWINANSDRKGIDSSNLSDFLTFIYKTLLENSIEIPFPQLDLHIKKEEK